MIEEFLNRAEFSDYEDFAKNLKINIPENFNFAYDVADRWAETEPEKQAIIWLDADGSEKRFTFGEIKDYSDRLANALTDLGIGRDDTVALILKRRWEFWPSIIACHKIGARALPINHLMKKKDLVYRFNSIEIKCLIAVDRPEFVEEMEKAFPECKYLKTKILTGEKRDGWLNWNNLVENASSFWVRPYVNNNSDIMLMYFTSGTTGFPKIVAHNYLYPLAHIITAKYFHEDTENGIDWTIADTGWAKASYGKLYGQWLCGTCVFVYDYNRFNSDSVLNMLSKYKITSFCAPPTVYRYFISEDLAGYDFSSVANASAVGEPLHPDVFKKFRDMTGIEIHEAFGQTESTCIVGTFSGTEPKPGSMGKANPLYNVFILNNENEIAKCGEEGKVAVYLGDVISSDASYPCHKYSQYPIGLFQGYIYDKEKNSQIYVNDFYLTGDVAKKDEDGYFWFVSRDDDVIKTSGYRVGPFEIESVLVAHPSVKECAVIGEPDFARGQIVKAFVVLNDGFEPTDGLSDELVEFVKQNTAPYKYPRKLEFINELPKNNNGKINRTLLKKGTV